MAATELKIKLDISGIRPGKGLIVLNTGYVAVSDWFLWGVSQDFYYSINAPVGYIATGKYWTHLGEPTPSSATSDLYLISYSGNSYFFKLHLGSKFGSPTVQSSGSMYGEYTRDEPVADGVSIYKTIVLDKKNKDYSLLFDCADLVPTTWSNIKSIATASTGDTKILFKLTDSPTDQNSTKAGNYLWAKYSDTEAPLILNIRPLDTETLRSPTVEISADFTDGSGSGIDLSTFQLFINKGTADEIFVDKYTEKNKGLKKLSENGFQFCSIAPFKSQLHNVFIRIADNNGNVTEQHSSFIVDVKSYNTNIGLLPIVQLSGIGGANAATFSSLGISTIGDLVNRDAAQLAIDSSLGLKFCTTAIQRARIACTEIKFIKGQFDELYSFTMNQIMAMTNNQLTALDIGKEDWQEIENIRENIGLLYICLDGPVVDAMTFGQLIWDQP